MTAIFLPATQAHPARRSMGRGAHHRDHGSPVLFRAHRSLAEPTYQARIQSVTSMAFTLGSPLGALWGGLAVDHFGLPALMVGAGVLAGIAILILIGGHNLFRKS